MTDDRRSLRDRADRGQDDREVWLAQRDEMNALVRENVPTLDAILPSHMNAAQFTAIVSGLLARDDDLAVAAIRNPTSFLAALADCAMLGLTPGDGYALVGLGVSENSSRNAKAEVLGMREYTGEIQLIFNTGLIDSIHAEVVFSNDHYVPGRHAHEAPEWSRGPTEFATDDERGQAVGAFCYCIDKAGNTTRVVRMNRQEIMAHREVAKTRKVWDGAFWRSMWLKTVTHEQYKWVAKSAEKLRENVRAAAALGGSSLGALPPPTEAELEVPTMKVRAIGAAPGSRQPQQRRGRPGNRTPYGLVMELFERIGVSDSAEQLRVVKAVCPDYQPGATISDSDATLVATQLQACIDDADDIGEPGTDQEFAGRTPYDVLREWLASPGPDDDVLLGQGVQSDPSQE